MAWKQVAISLCEIVAFFHQKLAIRSGPGALQFFFLLMILETYSAFRFQLSVGTSGTTSSIASLTSSIHSASASPLPFSFFTLLPCYPITLLPCYLVSVLHSYLVTLLPNCCLVTLLPFYPVTLLPCFLLPCYLVTRLPCCPVTLLSCYSLTLLFC